MVFAEEHQPKCAAAGKKPINALAFNDGNGAAEALMSRRADLFWLGSTAVSYFVAQSKGRTKVVGTTPTPAISAPALPKGSEMAAPLQAAIQHLIDNGTYQKIVDQMGPAGWGGEEGAAESDRRAEMSASHGAASALADRRTMRSASSRSAIPGPGRRASLAVLVAVGVLASVATNPAFQWPVVAQYMLDGQILAGLARTLELTVAAMVMGLVLGTALAVMRLSRQPAAVDAELALHLVLPQRARAGAADLLVQFRRALSAYHAAHPVRPGALQREHERRHHAADGRARRARAGAGGLHRRGDPRRHPVAFRAGRRARPRRSACARRRSSSASSSRRRCA